MPDYLGSIIKLFRMSSEKLLLIIILIFLILILNKQTFTSNITQLFPEIKNYLPTQTENSLVITENVGSNAAKVVHIADGDTVTIQLANGEEEIVRLLAVNTLETDSADNREKCFAKLAENFTSKTLLNSEVNYRPDPTQPKRDKYGRLLLYIKKIGETKDFNEELMYTGLAKTYKATPPAQEWQKYENIRKEMESQKKGIWDPNLCTGYAPTVL